MKLWIESDEKYPIYNWSTEPIEPIQVAEIDLTEEEFKKVEAAYELFAEVQNLLEQKFQKFKATK